MLIALLLYAIGAFFLLFSVYLQNALHVDALSAGLVFLPFGVGFLLGPLSTPLCTRAIGAYVNPLGMGLEIVETVGLACLIDTTPIGMPLASVPLAAALFVIGFGQGLALPTLMRMVTGRVAPAVSGMIAGIASSTLQVSTSLSVAIIGGIFIRCWARAGSRSHCTRVYRRTPVDLGVPRRRRRAGHLAGTCTGRAVVGALRRPAGLRPGAQTTVIARIDIQRCISPTRRFVMVFVVSYRRATGARFDARYYVEQHIPLVEKAWKPYGAEYVDTFFPARQDSEVAVVAMSRFADRAALDAAFASAETADIMADIDAFTDIAPDRYITDVFSRVE